MNLTHYLSEFLLQDGIIEIPTLGTFRIQYIPSHFDENHHIYSAPKKEIVFTNEEVGNKDIVQFIAEKENVQFNVAQKIWYVYVQALLDKLREEKKYALEGLGSLEVLEDGSYSFLPEKNPMLFGNTFGLEDLTNVQTFVPNPNPQMKIVEPLPVEANVPQKKEEETGKEGQGTKGQKEQGENEKESEKIREAENERTEIIKQDKVELIEQAVLLKEQQQNPSKSESIEAEEKIMEVEKEPLEVPESATDDLTPQDDEDEDENIIITQKKSGKGKRIFIGILLALIILAALFCCYLYYEKYERNKVETIQQEQPAIKPEVNEITQLPDSTQHEQDTIKEEAIQENLHKGETLIDGIVFMPDSKQGIDIIAGFFKVKENAIKEAKRMKNIGFDTYVIHRTRGTQEQYYVSISSFSKQSEAVNFMRTTYKEKKIELMLKKW